MTWERSHDLGMAAILPSVNDRLHNEINLSYESVRTIQWIGIQLFLGGSGILPSKIIIVF